MIKVFKLFLAPGSIALLRYVLRWILLLLVLVFTGCNEITSDRVYSLKLSDAPNAADWTRAPIHSVSVVGGRQHKIELFPDIDQDTVHTSTASCHHGAALPEPILVDLRSFYTATDLYLQLSWPDPTMDQAMRQWHYDGNRWQASAGLEDGFGILWSRPQQFDNFSCARACHMDDFGVQDARFQAHSRMKLTASQLPLDLWHWKAERTGKFGFADDRYIDESGMHADLPGELFRENSLAMQKGEVNGLPFVEGDRPVYAEDGQLVGTGFIPPGATAPGYQTELPRGDRADISATSNYAAGRWTVTLRRSLVTDSPRDIGFVPGQEYTFGISIMDNTMFDHYASKFTETLILLPADN